METDAKGASGGSEWVGLRNDMLDIIDYQLEKHQECAKYGNRQYSHGIRDARKIISDMFRPVSEGIRYPYATPVDPAQFKMTLEEAVWRIDEHMRCHELQEPQAGKITAALHMAIESLKKQESTNAEIETLTERLEDVTRLKNAAEESLVNLQTGGMCENCSLKQEYAPDGPEGEGK